MKTLITSLTLSLALCGAAGVTAQNWSSAPAASKADTMMLSEMTDGDYLVRRYVVNRPMDSDYSVRYQISMAKLVPALDGNKEKLADIDAFMSQVMKDTLLNVCRIEITGYASPDGTEQYNEALAKKRTMDFMAYVDSKYQFSKHFDVKTAWMADGWMAARPMIAQSDVPNKAEVLKVIDGNWTRMEKEAALKRMPGVWDYLKTKILPPMRRVELVINYGEGNIVEQRMLIPKPKVEPQPQPCQPCIVVDETITGMIVEMPDTPADFEKMTREERKEFRRMEKMAYKEAKAAEKLARKEAKIAKKLLKEMDKQ